MKQELTFCQWYGTRAQGICPFSVVDGICRGCPESKALIKTGKTKAVKVWIKVPGRRKVAIDKVEMDAVLAKYRELGIRRTEENILASISKALKEFAAENPNDPLTDEKIITFWRLHKQSVLKTTLKEVVSLLGYDPRKGL
jgi:hypothetical protein